MIMNDAQRIRLLLKELKRRLPVKSFNVKFSSRDIKEEGSVYGPYNHKYGGKFCYLIVRKTLNYAAKVDSLLHEYAHLRLLDRGIYSEDEQKQHCAEWGKEYSKVYKEFLKINAEMLLKTFAAQ
jgi:hypothetical protein